MTTARIEPRKNPRRASRGHCVERFVLLDDDRTPTRAGDTVYFNYGIPPIGVRAKIIQRGRSLIALTPGHTPPECTLRTLRRHVGGWVKQNVKDQPRPENDKTK